MRRVQVNDNRRNHTGKIGQLFAARDQFVGCKFRDTKTMSWGLASCYICSWALGAVTRQWRELSGPDVIDQNFEIGGLAVTSS
jgi:hypothetical protein